MVVPEGLTILFAVLRVTSASCWFMGAMAARSEVMAATSTLCEKRVCTSDPCVVLAMVLAVTTIFCRDSCGVTAATGPLLACTASLCKVLMGVDVSCRNIGFMKATTGILCGKSTNGTCGFLVGTGISCWFVLGPGIPCGVTISTDVLCGNHISSSTPRRNKALVF